MKFLRSNAGMDANQAAKILVDTSVIIDGRIADIARAGFVPGTLLVPRFVLAELQNIADSSDAMRRSRGRRGLEMLNSIRVTEDVDMEVIDDDVENIQEVDAKLVALARKLGTSILTTDYNLNRVAQIEGVRVLNINELANAIRPVILPGERMMVKIVQAGKEKGQGVGYLADGTMIVVDQGDKMMGQDVESEITRVFQTVAGKMLFAVPVSPPKAGSLASPTVAKVDALSKEHKLDQKANAPRPLRQNNQNNRTKKHRPNAGQLSREQTSNVNQNKPKDTGKNQSAKPARRKNPTQRLEDSLIELTGGQ